MSRMHKRKQLCQLSEPKRRRGRRQKTEPFPVPTKSSCGQSPNFQTWNFFSGELVGDTVLVKHSGDMKLLYNMGFYGKGNLSQHEPWFSLVQNQKDKHKDKQFLLLSKRKYERHKQWYRDHTGMPDVTDGNSECSTVRPADEVSPSCLDQSEKSEQVDNDDMLTSHVKATAAPSWIDGEEDMFYPTENSANENNELELKFDHAGLKCSDTVDSWEVYDEAESKAFWLLEDAVEERSRQASPGMETNAILTSTAAAWGDQHNGSFLQQTESDVTNISSDLGRSDAKQVPSLTGDDVESLHSNLTCPTREECLDVHQHCDALVVNDYGDLKNSNSDRKCRPDVSLKCDPYKVAEDLQLTLEEAFFLVYGLGCLLVVHRSSNNPLQITDLWRRFCEMKPRFAFTYAAYHHYRSIGWVPKPGVKFGGDFILYKQGPPFYHSTYVVIVQEPSTSGKKSGHSILSDWTRLISHSRVAEQVSKDLLLCEIMMPLDLSIADITQSPEFLHKCSVQDILIRRWVSKNEAGNNSLIP